MCSESDLFTTHNNWSRQGINVLLGLGLEVRLLVAHSSCAFVTSSQNLPFFVQFHRGKAASRTSDRKPDVCERSRFQAVMVDVEPPAEPAKLKTVAEPAVPPPEHPVRRLFMDVTGSEPAAHDPINTTFGSISKPRSPSWSHESSLPRSIEIQYRDSRYESDAVRRTSTYIAAIARGSCPRVNILP